MSIFDVFDRISANSQNARGKIEYVIAGLGNPGLEYENTRHNAGFIVLDMLAKQCGEEINRMQFKGRTADVMLGDKRCLLLKPTTYMTTAENPLVRLLNSISLTYHRSLLCAMIFRSMWAGSEFAAREAMAVTTDCAVYASLQEATATSA